MKKLAVGLVAVLTLAPFHPAVLPVAEHPATTNVAAVAGRAADRTVTGTVRLLGMVPTPTTAAADHGGHSPSGGHQDLVLIAGAESWLLTGKQPRPNTRVRVTGTVTDHTMHATAVTEIGAAPSPVPPRGTSRVLVMLANWSQPDHVTQESAREQMFTDSNAWYRDASYGKVGLTGDVTPWMHIAGPADGRCYADSAAIMAQAKASATALGYKPDEYDNVVVYFPNNGWQPGSDCNAYAGWAYVGAAGTWLNGYMDRRVTVHELGHNYGLWHSHSYLCSNVLSGSCAFQDYGDAFDAMGSSGYVGHFSASQKQLLGWLDGRLVDLSNGGSATLAPMAADPVTTTAVRVAVSGGRTYWLEYRQPVDYDSALPAEGTDGVLIHVTDQAIASDGGSNLIDVRPSDGLSAFSATLRPHTSWRAPEGFRFSVGAVTAAGAAVTVETGTDGEPTVTARTPAPGEVSVNRSSTITATFSEEVTGVGTKTFTVKKADGSAVKAKISRVAGTDRWVLDPSSDLSSDTRYTVTLTGGDSAIRDADGNPLETTTWTFGTGPRPTVKSRKPAADGSNVSRTAPVAVTFSEKVTGVDGTSFTLRNATTGAEVPTRVVRGSDSSWELRPLSSLAADSRYTVTLTGGPAAVRDRAGNPLITTSWSFATGPVPTVTSRAPGSNAKNVSRTEAVAATFSEEVSGVDTASFRLKETTSGKMVTATVTRDGATHRWILDPSDTLKAATKYTVLLTGGPTAIRDVAGNALAGTSWSFTTRR